MELFKLFGSIFVKTDDAEKSISKMSDKAEGFGSKLVSGIGTVAKWGGAIVTAAGTASMAIGTMAAKAASSYETNFAKVSTLLTGSESDFEKYKKALLDASTATGIAADEMSEAVYSAISASVDQDSAIEFAKKAASLAKGGFTDTATAVDVLTTAINAYGMSVEDTDRISNMLINTQNLGKTTVNELASSMGKIIPTANSFGVSMDVLCGSYAEITKNGIATAEATTYMNGMFNELGKSSTKVSKTLKEKTGKSFKELMEDGMSITDVLGILDESAKGAGMSMADMFGSSEAAKAATVLYNNAADLTECIESMREASGTTEEAAKKMSETIEARVSKLKNSLTNISISLGTMLMPIVEKAVEYIEKAMPFISELFERFSPILEKVFNLAVEGFMMVADVIGNFVAWVQDHSEQIKSIVNTLFTFISEIYQYILKPVFEAIFFVVGLVKDAFAQHMPEIQVFFTEMVTGISDTWNNHLKPCFDAIGIFLQTVLKPIFEKVFKVYILPVVEMVFNSIKKAWESVLKPVFNGICDFLTGVFTGNWKLAFEGIVGIVKGAVNAVIGGFEWMVNGAIGSINKILAGISVVASTVGSLIGLDPVSLSIDYINLPRLAKGGVLAKGQVGLLEGDGAEAVVPLDQNKKWISQVASEFNNQMGNASDKKIQQLIDVVSELTERLPDMMIEAATSTSFEINKREFARLVKEV